MEDNPRWCNASYSLIEKRVKHISKMNEEEFRVFIREEEIRETCDLIQRLGMLHSRRGVLSGPLSNFIVYLSRIMFILVNARKENMNLILMENALPFDLYLFGATGFERWICTSRIDFFEAFFAQGYTMENLQGNIEETLTRNGNIDVFDFFIEKETEESGHVFKSSIVFYACLYKNVDILQRLVNKCYSMNESYKRYISNLTYPIYEAFSERYTGTGILDILIMAGADVNLTFTSSVSPLMRAYYLRAEECFQRLIDVGARVKNETDIMYYFYMCRITVESLKIFIKAGMDLHYKTTEGTVLEIVKTINYRHSLPDDVRDVIVFIQETLGNK